MDYFKLAEKLLKTMPLPAKTQGHGFGKCLQSHAHMLIMVDRLGDTTPTDIADLLNVSTARVAVVLGELEAKGLITREIDGVDRRRIVVKLTAAGKDMSKKHQREAIAKRAQFLQELGEHDAQEYVRIMGKIADIMRKKNMDSAP